MRNSSLGINYSILQIMFKNFLAITIFSNYNSTFNLPELGNIIFLQINYILQYSF